MVKYKTMDKELNKEIKDKSKKEKLELIAVYQWCYKAIDFICYFLILLLLVCLALLVDSFLAATAPMYGWYILGVFVLWYILDYLSQMIKVSNQRKCQVDILYRMVEKENEPRK